MDLARLQDSRRRRSWKLSTKKSPQKILRSLWSAKHRFVATQPVLRNKSPCVPQEVDPPLRSLLFQTIFVMQPVEDRLRSNAVAGRGACADGRWPESWLGRAPGFQVLAARDEPASRVTSGEL